MNKATANRFRALLEKERVRLAEEVAQIEREGHEALSEASGENNYRDHMADQGTATFARELDMTLEGNVREALVSVLSALEKTEQGTYGVCERCGSAINEERLMAIPTASLCITCKSLEESR